MGKTLDLGQRIELHAMDKYCSNISLALYRRELDRRSQVRVHTYAAVAGVQERVEFLTEALIVLAGLERVPEQPGWLAFCCPSFHLRALKRTFLDPAARAIPPEAALPRVRRLRSWKSNR